MRIGVPGTGTVGQAIAGRLAELDHEVLVGTRDPATTLAREAPDGYGNPPFKVWHEQHPGVKVGTFADAAPHGELVVNATAGEASLDALDFSRGMPPSLLVANTDSLGERIQRAFSDVKVVKALNTMTAAVMVNPGQLGGGDHAVFVCGDNPEAKALVTGILQELGWRDVLDLGDLSAARAAEMVLPIWLRLMGALQTPMFNFKVVR